MTPVLAQTSIGDQFTEMFGDVVAFLPKLLAFLAILIIGYFVARALERLVNAVLERVGFDRAVERGGVKRVFDRSQYDASDLLAKIVFYAVMLFVLQLAFGVFGPNPISELIQGVITFLPKVFAAILIVVVASAIAAAVREVVSASLGGLSYGNALVNAAGVVIVAIGIFAALNQIEIAPAIVNGLFYALLAIVAGSAIVAIGGSGIAPLRSYWERALERLDEESSRIREESRGSSDASRGSTEQRRPPTEQDTGDRSTGGAVAADPDGRGRTRDWNTWDEPDAYGGDPTSGRRR